MTAYFKDFLMLCLWGNGKVGTESHAWSNSHHSRGCPNLVPRYPVPSDTRNRTQVFLHASQELYQPSYNPSPYNEGFFAVPHTVLMRSHAENATVPAVCMIHPLGYQEHHGGINFPSAGRKHTGKESSLDPGQKGLCLPPKHHGSE